MTLVPDESKRIRNQRLAACGALIWFFHGWTNESLFQTGWFVESLLSQKLVVHVIRTGKIPFVQSKPSLPLLVTTVGICVLGSCLPTSSLAPALDLTALPSPYAVTLVMILVGYLTLTQLAKGWIVRRFGVS